MAERKPRGRRGPPPIEGVVRRPASERKRLPPEMEALARGEIERLPRPTPRPRLSDPRTHALVPGVANRDARLVYDVRVDALRAAAAAWRADPGDADGRARLARLLDEAFALGVWRGRSVTALDAFVEQVLELEPREARALAAEHDATGARTERLSDETVAVWMRVEAALAEAGLEAKVTARRDADGVERLHLEAIALAFPAIVDAAFRRQAPLARDVSRKALDHARDHDGRGFAREQDRPRPSGRGRDEEPRGAGPRDRPRRDRDR